MSPAEELQRLVFATLTADSGLGALIDGVYDRVPDAPFGPKQAYVSFGPTDEVPDDADCIVTSAHTLQIDVWTRGVGAVGCKGICRVVKKLLHDRDDLELTEHALALLWVGSVQVFLDADGLTHHGVVVLTAEIEEVD
jgi:hypothetical protein